MNIDWMCLLKAIGNYGLILLICCAVFAAIIGLIWLMISSANWLLSRFLGWRTIDSIGQIVGVIMFILVFVAIPIYWEYQKTCP